jgi:two-component system nitrate/nitrite response regulator NarL
MEQLFITPRGKPMDRWLQAFADAVAVVDMAAVSKDSAANCGAIWLDTSVISLQDTLAWLKQAVALGRPVVIMASTPGEAEAFQLLSNGAMGYCHVKAAPEQLREIALVVENGGLWMPPELMQRFLALSVRVVPKEAPQAQELNDLTARELMVAEQVAHGASNREIAETLDITERTVKAHLSAIFKKMNVRDRVQLALAINNIPTYSTIN